MRGVEHENVVEALGLSEPRKRSQTAFMFGARTAVRTIWMPVARASASKAAPNLSSRSAGPRTGCRTQSDAFGMAIVGKCITLAWVRYIWDPKKARSNYQKHSISFEEAVTSFADPLAIIADDLVHPERAILIGMSWKARILLTVFHREGRGRDPTDHCTSGNPTRAEAL